MAQFNSLLVTGDSRFLNTIQGNCATATSATSSSSSTISSNLGSNTRMEYGWNGVNYFNMSGTASAGVKVNDVPTSTWWHIMRFNHANNSGYYTDLAVPFNANSLYYKRIMAGNLQNGGWVQVLDVKNSGYAYSDNVSYESSGKKFTCTKSANAWDSQVYSTNRYKDNVYVTFKPGQTNCAIMVGLATNPSSSASYNAIDYCWYTQNDGGLCMYESGTAVSSITGHTTYSVGDELVVEYSGGMVKYFHNGVLCRSVNRTIGSPLYMDSSIHASGYIYDVDFGTTPCSSSNMLTRQAAALSTTAELNAFGVTHNNAMQFSRVAGSLGTVSDGLVVAFPWSAAYGHQLFLDDNQNVMQHRAYVNGTWNTWATLIDTGNFSSNLSSSVGSYALQRIAWWSSTDTTKNVDDLKASITFAYNGKHGTPITGTTVAFDCSTNQNYTLQMQGGYSTNQLYYRNRNGDKSTWGSWLRVMTAQENPESISLSITKSSGISTIYSSVAKRYGKVVHLDIVVKIDKNYMYGNGIEIFTGTITTSGVAPITDYVFSVPTNYVAITSSGAVTDFDTAHFAKYFLSCKLTTGGVLKIMCCGEPEDSWPVTTGTGGIRISGTYICA